MRILTAVTAVIPALHRSCLALRRGRLRWLVLGLYLVVCSIAVWRMPDGDEKMIPAKKLFGFSILYLFAIFAAALLVDQLCRGPGCDWLMGGTAPDGNHQADRCAEEVPPRRNIAAGVVLAALVGICSTSWRRCQVRPRN